jgi:hypothetical protein
MKPGKWRKILLSAISICISVYSYAQVFIENPPTGRAADPVINMYGAGTLIVSIPYEKVRGSAFWKDEWQTAFLYGDNAKDKWFCKARLNLATGEVYFLDRANQELVAGNTINLIVFYKENDTSSVDAVFANVNNYPDLIQTQTLTNGYLQVLNRGKYELLKYYKRTVSTADSLFGTLKRYYFTTQYRYFIAGNQKIEPLKKPGKENILLYLPGSSSFGDWIAANKIDFRKEEDVVKFLDYYNSKIQ